MSFADEIAYLLREIDGEFNPPLSKTVDIDAYANKLFKFATNFSVHDSGRLVGLMSVYCNDEVNRIAFGSMLAVASTHRVYGIGPNLIKATLDFLKKKSFKSFQLEIYKTNPRVVTLYKRMKFMIFKETENSVFVKFDLQ